MSTTEIQACTKFETIKILCVYNLYMYTSINQQSNLCIWFSSFMFLWLMHNYVIMIFHTEFRTIMIFVKTDIWQLCFVQRAKAARWLVVVVVGNVFISCCFCYLNHNENLLLCYCNCSKLVPSFCWSCIVFDVVVHFILHLTCFCLRIFFKLKLYFFLSKSVYLACCC